MPVLIGVAAAVGFLAGALVVGQTDILGSNRSSEATPVSAGAVKGMLETSPGGRDFELPVFNSTAARLDVSVAAFEGTTWVVRSDAAENIAPGTWGAIPFSITTSCDIDVPGHLPSVRLRVSSPHGESVVAVPLPGEGTSLRDYNRALCAVGEPVLAGELAGVWLIEEVYGEDAGFVGRLLLRFERDGSVTADPEGGLFSGDVGARGTYRLQGELLHLDLSGPYGCGSGQVTWRVTVANDRMTMVWVRGDCPRAEQGDLWSARRVLRDVGLPGTRD